jgi:hypothetical protein
MKIYPCSASDLVFQEHLGRGAFGDVDLMLLPTLQLSIAVKVATNIINNLVSMLEDSRWWS